MPGQPRGSYLRPPAGEDKVSVDVLFSELLGHVEPQRAVFVIDVPFGGVIQDGVSVVDLLELVGSLGIVGILVGVELQCQFPGKQTGHSKRICHTSAFGPGPGRLTCTTS